MATIPNITSFGVQDDLQLAQRNLAKETIALLGDASKAGQLSAIDQTIITELGFTPITDDNGNIIAFDGQDDINTQLLGDLNKILLEQSIDLASGNVSGDPTIIRNRATERQSLVNKLTEQGIIDSDSGIRQIAAFDAGTQSALSGSLQSRLSTFAGLGLETGKQLQSLKGQKVSGLFAFQQSQIAQTQQNIQNRLAASTANFPDPTFKESGLLTRNEQTGETFGVGKSAPFKQSNLSRAVGTKGVTQRGV